MENGIVIAALLIMYGAFMWECAWLIKKKLFPVHIGDHQAPCACGSATTQVEGRRTHYTPAEFNARLLKKYNRRGSGLRIKDNGLHQLSQEINKNPGSRKLIEQYTKLAKSRDKEALRLVEKYNRKWIQCVRCGATSRRHYMPKDVQAAVDFGIHGSTQHPTAMTEAVIALSAQRGEEE